LPGAATSRCRRLPQPHSSGQGGHGASQRTHRPFGVSCTARQLTPELPPSGYLRRAWGFSPIPRLDGAPCVPGLFHPGAAHGVSPFRASSLRRALAPLGTSCPPDVCLSLPAPSRSPAGLVTSTLPSGRPRLAAQEAKRLNQVGAPARADRTALAPRDLPGRPLAGPLPSIQAFYSHPGSRCRTAERRQVRLQGFRLSARSSVPSAGC
jgi:hypothetical protein